MVVASEAEVRRAGERLARDDRPWVRRGADRGAAESGCPIARIDMTEMLPMPRKPTFLNLEEWANSALVFDDFKSKQYTMG